MSTLGIENSSSPINSSVINNAAANKSENELDQSDFIELLVAQVKNQDPTKPMDPSQFMNQLTQSSMVNGINDLQKSFDSLSTRISSDQSMQAASLVGQSVLLPGGEGVFTAGNTISGELALERQASEVSLKIFNSRGEQVRTLPLGGSDAGSMQFQWDGFADDGSVVPEGDYLVTAEGLIDGEQQAIEVYLEARIDSVSLNQSINGSSNGTLLNLASGQSVPLDDIEKIK